MSLYYQLGLPACFNILPAIICLYICPLSYSCLNSIIRHRKCRFWSNVTSVRILQCHDVVVLTVCVTNLLLTVTTAYNLVSWVWTVVRDVDGLPQQLVTLSGSLHKYSLINKHKQQSIRNQCRTRLLCFSTFSDAFTCLTEKWLTKSTLPHQTVQVSKSTLFKNDINLCHLQTQAAKIML